MAFWNVIYESLKDKFNQISHTRIASYAILITLIINALIFMGIDIHNSFKVTGIYEIPATHVVLFGMILTHHLALLGLKKYSETAQTKIASNSTTSDSSSTEEPK